jgi:hypothetical protein
MKWFAGLLCVFALLFVLCPAADAQGYCVGVNCYRLAPQSYGGYGGGYQSSPNYMTYNSPAYSNAPAYSTPTYYSPAPQAGGWGVGFSIGSQYAAPAPTYSYPARSYSRTRSYYRGGGQPGPCGRPDCTCGPNCRCGRR